MSVVTARRGRVRLRADTRPRVIRGLDGVVRSVRPTPGLPTRGFLARPGPRWEGTNPRALGTSPRFKAGTMRGESWLFDYGVTHATVVRLQVKAVARGWAEERRLEAVAEAYRVSTPAPTIPPTAEQVEQAESHLAAARAALEADEPP